MQVVAHNILAQYTSRQLNINTKSKQKTSEKLLSGYRINRSADDAAGLQISEKMRWQIRGLGKGSNNVQDGVSILQVAEGALGDVHSMLDRIKELSVQAANDTNTDSDRQAIQQEVDSLLEEIDRIGSDTEFNTKKVFEGGYEDILDANGNPVSVKDIEFKNFTLATADITSYPFNTGSDGDYLKFAVSTADGYSAGNWNLIYGSGYTSNSTVRLSYMDDNGHAITSYRDIGDMPISNVQINNNGQECIRTFSYDAGNGAKIELTQTITVTDSDTQKYYDVNWKIVNTGSKAVGVEFMFNADTAYNNNDHCEEYFITNNKVDKFCMYTTDNKYLSQPNANIYDYSTSSLKTAKSFSIIDSDNALPFTEKVSWEDADRPDTVTIGHWPEGTGDWDYYDNLSSHLGGSTSDKDIAFSLIWNKSVVQGGNTEIKFKYGIESTATDANVQTVAMTSYSGSRVHTNELDLWIQAGATEGNGLFITIGEMNSGELGLRGLDVTTHRDAGNAMTRVDNAIEKISKQRSSIGAFQNRLEYSKTISDNTAENTQSAESHIRDADMATEMVSYSKHNILEQAGQSLLAQANQSTQGIVSLLSE